jgi:hypothetical protein
MLDVKMYEWVVNNIKKASFRALFYLHKYS